MAFVAPLAAGLAAAAPSAATVGSALTAGSTILGGLATSAAAQTNANIANYNAQVAENAKTYALESGGEQAQQKGLQGAEQVGAVTTALAANNVDVNTGSAKDVRADTREQAALEEQTTTNNAALKAWGYQNTATGYQLQGQLDESEAAEAPIGAALGAGGGLLSSASATGAFSKWTGGGGGFGGGAVNPYSGTAVTPAGSGFGVGV
jgi:hypothetical protein